MISPARRAAYEVVLRVFEQDAYADRVLRGAVEGLDARDRALAQRLAYGTVQRVRTLDHGIETLGRRPVRKLDPPVRAALRLGAYQLAFMETAAHAAVAESVELVRRARLERAVPFTNAVLRRLAEGLTPLLDGLPEATPEQAALRHSYPDWVARTWWDELGRDDALALMRAQNEPPEPRRPAQPAARRPRRARPGRARRAPRRAGRRGGARRGPDLAAERGSQLAGLAVGSREGERTLDLCAAPGGKATQLAGDVVAVEIHPGRARELRENVERLGATNVTVVEADALDLPPELGGFDRALVDAPCSGLGVLARRPDLRWRARAAAGAPARAAPRRGERVRPGGTIVYSVCTINAAENEEIVDARRPRGRARSARSGPLRAPAAAGVPAHAAARARDERVLRRAPARSVGSRRGLGRLDPHGRGRAVAVRGRLRPPRRPGRGALRAGVRVFHFDVGDGHFVPPITIGPVVLRGIAPIGMHDARRRARLPPDGRQPRAALRRSSRSPARTASPSTTRSVGDDLRRDRGRARELELGRRRLQPRVRAPRTWRRRRRRERRPRPLHEHPSRLLGAGVHAGGARPDRGGCASCSRRAMHVQVDGGVGHDNVRALHDAGATCSSRARRSSAAKTCRAPSGGSSKRSGEPRAGARARGRGARPRARTRPSARSSSPTARWWGRAGTEHHGGRHGEVVALEAAGDGRAARRST